MRLSIICGVAICAALVGGAGGYRLKALRVEAAASAAARAEAQRAAQVAKQDQAAADISQRAGNAARQSQADIAAQTHTIIERIPVYVTDLSACPVVPEPAVGLLDAAATGDLSRISDAAAGADDPAPAIDTAQALRVAVENYGTCRANADRHNRLIDWVVAQAQLAGE